MTDRPTLLREIRERLDALDALERTTIIRSGDNLLSLIEQREAGHIFALDPAFSTDLGTWTITKPITLTSSVALGPGRVDPAADLPSLTLRSLVVAAEGVRIEKVRLTGTVRDVTLVTTGPGTVLDQLVLIGSVLGQRRGVTVNSDGWIIRCSHIGNIWHDQDAQAVAGWNGCAHGVIDDCFLESSGMNVAFGDANPVSYERIAHDVLIEGCLLSKPYPAWFNKPGCSIKNLFEIKNGRQMTIRRCDMDGSWTGSQGGYAIMLTVRGNTPTSADFVPFSTIEDVLFEDVRIHNVGAGVNILGRDDHVTRRSGRMRGVTFRRVSIDGLGALPGDKRQLLIQGGPQDLRLGGVTFTGTPGLNSFLVFAQPEHKLEGFAVDGFEARQGDYGIFCSQTAPGTAALDLYAPGYGWQNVRILKDTARNISYPAGTTVVPI